MIHVLTIIYASLFTFQVLAARLHLMLESPPARWAAATRQIRTSTHSMF